MSGGACGALGAAIWVNETINGKEGDSYNAINERAGALVDRFLACSDYQFECREIVGRKSTSIDDHAAHVQAGGCAEIVETLARQIENGCPELEKAV